MMYGSEYLSPHFSQVTFINEASGPGGGVGILITLDIMTRPPGVKVFHRTPKRERSARRAGVIAT